MGGLGKLFTKLTGNFTSLFVEIPFVSFYKMVESVTQQIRDARKKQKCAFLLKYRPL